MARLSWKLGFPVPRRVGPLLAGVQMGAVQPERFTRAPPVPGERFLGSFSRARGEFLASGLPLLLWVGSF